MPVRAIVELTAKPGRRDELAEARDALMQDAATMEAMTPILELLAAPFRATVVSRLT